MPIPVFENVRQEKLPKFQFQFLSLGKSGNQGCLTTMRGLDGNTGCEADSGSQRSLVGVEVEPGREERGGHVEDEDRDGSTNDAVIAPSIPWRHDEDNFVFARVSLVELFEAGVSPNLPLALRMRQGMPAQVEGRANLEDDAGFQIRRQEHVNPEDTDVVQQRHRGSSYSKFLILRECGWQKWWISCCWGNVFSCGCFLEKLSRILRFGPLLI